MDDLLASLAEGESFTKLDLADAYQQIVLDEESSKLVTILIEDSFATNACHSESQQLRDFPKYMYVFTLLMC